MFKKDEYKAKVLGLSRVQEFYDSKSQGGKTADVYLSSIIKLNRFLESKYNLNCDNVIAKLKPKSRNKDPEMDVYKLLRDYIIYLPTIVKRITASSVDGYVSALRSYFQFHDIDIIPYKFKNRVTMPKIIKGKKETPISKFDIAEFVTVCNVPRLKAYMLVLGSSGVRDTSEALVARNCDLFDTETPCRLHLRGEYTKTDTERDVFISDEALHYLNQFKPQKERVMYPNKLLFSSYDLEPKESDKETLQQVTNRMAHNLYGRLNEEFHKVLTKVGKDQFKENQVNRIQKRHAITLHAFRRFASTAIENNSLAKGYHDFLLGHNGPLSGYHTQDEEKIRSDYLAIMPHLTFFDFTAQDKDAKEIKTKLYEKDEQVDKLNRQVLQLTEQLQTIISSLSLADQSTKNKMAKSLIDSGVFK